VKIKLKPAYPVVSAVGTNAQKLSKIQRLNDLAVKGRCRNTFERLAAIGAKLLLILHCKSEPRAQHMQSHFRCS